MNDMAIHAEGLVKEFAGKRAVDSIDLAVPKGEIYGFLGPNGAGKSTTVRMLTTLLKPTLGTAVVAGSDVIRNTQQARLSIGAALQEAALDHKQTGVGGDDSWGAKAHLKYTLQAQPYSYTFTLRPVRGDQG